MSEKTEPSSASDADAPVNAPAPEEAEAIVRSLALVRSNALLYGLSHNVTRKSVDDAFAKVGKALETCSEVDFSVMDDVLMVNGTAIDTGNPMTDSFVRHLVKIESPSFSMERGLAPERFARFMGVLNAKLEELRQLGGVSSALVSANIEHVRAKKMIYKRIDEGDVVLSQEKMAQIVAAGQGDVDVLVSFLKGDPPEGDKEVAANLKKITADSGLMGRLIVDIAETGKEEKGLPVEETLTGMAVKSLQRVFKEMAQDPSVKTQKGKRELEKTLVMLEGSVKRRIMEISGRISDEDTLKLSNAVESMVDELRIDALADEYMKKREALDKNEQRLLRFMKGKGIDRLSDTELEARLAASGLTAEDWRNLLVKSGLISRGESDAAPAGERLAELISTIRESASKAAQAGPDARKEQVGQLVASIDTEVKTLVQKTTSKIQGLVEVLKADRDAADAAEQAAARAGKAPQISRKRFFEILAEIGQELCQPLAVISCSIDILAAGALGTVTVSQQDMLKLAAESGRKLKVLIDNFIEIAGVPETRSPDAGIQALLYASKEKA
ncbi:MAG: hypothetical protein QME60_00310 [Verrucomicrobiota bacterium]|nr:hypothetical protein [Verrucomicrobiota bacterium]